jgi:hypothetical protein
MPRTVLRVMPIRKVYPDRDALANLAYRLCVFREDLYLEMVMLSQDTLEPLDRGDPMVRKIYATRRATISLVESSRAMYEPPADDLIAHGKAQGYLRSFDELRAKVQADVAELGQARNKLSAHIDDRRVKQILCKHGDFEGPIQIGNRVMDTAYRLPVHAMLMGYVPKADTEKEATDQFEQVLTKVRSAHVNALYAIDTFMLCYLTETGVWKLAR